MSDDDTVWYLKSDVDADPLVVDGDSVELDVLLRLEREGKATRKVRTLPNGGLEVTWSFKATVEYTHPTLKCRSGA
jgi:hypothetical protein